MNIATPVMKRTIKDFTSDQEVRWCPGCGDYAILKAVQKTLVDIDADPDRTVFVSGIGCAARFPYYVSTYGFHTIHGRAPAFATGIKLSNPELDVWLITGDGDALSIGGNHLVHVLRRNVDMQILLFNNEIYGLTKGQYSPTTQKGTRTPSSPQGSVDAPLSATLLALGAGARFVARGIDRLQKDLPGILARAHAHKGASFVEIYQNCIIYNDGVFEGLTEKGIGEDHRILLEHGKPMIFGRNRDKGLVLNHDRLALEVVDLGEGVDTGRLLVHDETNKTMASMLAAMEGPDMPVALGVLYCNPDASYEQEVTARENHDRADADRLNAMLRQGRCWTVGEDGTGSGG